MTDQQTPEVKPAGAEFMEKVKAILSKLPLAEKLSAGGGILLLIGMYAIDSVKTQVSGSSSFLGDLSGYGKASVTFADSDAGFWFILGLVGAIVAIALPFIDMIAPKFKLPLPKPMLMFVAGIVGGLAPVLNYLFTDDKSQTFYGVTIKLVPDLGMYLMVAAGAAIAYGGFQAGGLKQLMAFFGKAKAPAQTPPPAAPKA